jgi:hypothetical protein
LVGIEVRAHSIVHVRVRAIACLITIALMVVTVYAMPPFLPFFARPRLHSPTKGFVLARSNMSSKVVDLTNDDSSSDDGSSVDGRPDPKRWRISAASSTGSCILSSLQ